MKYSLAYRREQFRFEFEVFLNQLLSRSLEGLEFHEHLRIDHRLILVRI